MDCLRRLFVERNSLGVVLLVFLLLFGTMFFGADWSYVVVLVLIVMQVEFSIILYRFIKTGSLYPGSLLLLRMLEHDDLMGYNLGKDFSTSRLWKGSEIRRKNLESYVKGLGNSISINSLRYRGRSLPLKKAEEVIRIVVLGDSTTFGLLNDDEFVWSFLLEKELTQLAEGSRKFEVLNLAVGGYRFEQSVQRYLRDYLEYDVDLFINASFINDFKYHVVYESQAYGGLNSSNARIKQFFSHKRMTHAMRYLWNKSLCRALVQRVSAGLLDVLAYVEQKKDRGVQTKPTVRAYGDYSVCLDKYREFYREDRRWITNYRSSFCLLYNRVRERHPSCKFYLIGWPVLMSSHEFYNNTEGHILPDSLSYNLYNGRSYDSSNPDMVEHHAKYLAHSLLFAEILIKLAREHDDCKFIVPYETICNVPFEKRDSIFCDEYHLTNEGCVIFAKEMAQLLVTDIKRS